MLGFLQKLCLLSRFCIGQSLALRRFLDRFDHLLRLLNLLDGVRSHQALAFVAVSEFEVQVSFVEGSYSNWNVLSQMLEDGASSAEVSSHPKSNLSNTSKARGYGTRPTG
jgi:hypothetical protein